MKKYLITILGRIGFLWQNQGTAFLVYFNIFLIALQLGLILGFGHLLPPLIPLFYSRPWGRAQLANPASLFILPDLSFLILLLNSCLTIIFLKESVLAKLYPWASNLFAFLALLAILRLFFTFIF